MVGLQKTTLGKLESVSLSKILSKQVQLDEEMIIGLYVCVA